MSALASRAVATAHALMVTTSMCATVLLVGPHPGTVTSFARCSRLAPWILSPILDSAILLARCSRLAATSLLFDVIGTRVLIGLEPDNKGGRCTVLFLL